jgi:hypothetical protein
MATTTTTKVYLGGSCFLSLFVPEEGRCPGLHNEIQLQYPLTLNLVFLLYSHAFIGSLPANFFFSSELSFSLSLSLSLSLSPTDSTYLRPLFRSLAPRSQTPPQTPPQQPASIVSKRNPSPAQSKTDQAARLPRRKPRLPRNDRHAKRQTHTKQSAVTVNTTTSNSGICQEGEKWRAARVATSMSGWMVDGVGVAIGARTGVGVAVAPSS